MRTKHVLRIIDEMTGEVVTERGHAQREHKYWIRQYYDGMLRGLQEIRRKIKTAERYSLEDDWGELVDLARSSTPRIVIGLSAECMRDKCAECGGKWTLNTKQGYCGHKCHICLNK